MSFNFFKPSLGISLGELGSAQRNSLLSMSRTILKSKNSEHRRLHWTSELETNIEQRLIFIWVFHLFPSLQTYQHVCHEFMLLGTLAMERNSNREKKKIIQLHFKLNSCLYRETKGYIFGINLGKSQLHNSRSGCMLTSADFVSSVWNYFLIF